MALTFTPIYKGKFSDRRLHLYSVTFDSSYAAGGEAVTANDLGLNSIDVVIPAPGIVGRVAIWDSTASKLMAFASGSSATAVLAESTAATDLSAFVTQVIAIGL